MSPADGVSLRRNGQVGPEACRDCDGSRAAAGQARSLPRIGESLRHNGASLPPGLWELIRRYDEAIRQYEEAIELDPQQPAIHRNLGMLLAQLGRYDEAIPHLRATLQMVPNEPAARETLNEIEASRR